MYTRNGERVHSSDIPLHVYNSLRCKARNKVSRAKRTQQVVPKVIKVSKHVPHFYSPSHMRSSKYAKSKFCLETRSDKKPLITPTLPGQCYITHPELYEFIKFIKVGKRHDINKALHTIMTPCDEIVNYMPGACVKGWNVVRKLGQGVSGAVFLAEKDGMQAALKIVVDSPDSANFVTVEAEVRMQQKFADAGLAPKIYCHGKTQVGQTTVHVILMEPVDFTLNAFMCRDVVTREALKEIAMSLFRMLLKMRKLGVTHGDMHTENVAFRVQPDGTYKMLLIDFGQSSLRVHRPLVDAEQLYSDLVENEEASPEITRYIKRVLTFYLQKVAGELRPLKGRRAEFFKRHRSYEPFMGF